MIKNKNGASGPNRIDHDRRDLLLMAGAFLFSVCIPFNCKAALGKELFSLQLINAGTTSEALLLEGAHGVCIPSISMGKTNNRLDIEVSGITLAVLLEAVKTSNLAQSRCIRSFQVANDKLHHPVLSLHVTCPLKVTQRVLSPTNCYRSRIEILFQEPTAVAPSQKRVSPGASKKKSFVIVLDPGHGGKDPGAVGALGLKEKDVVLRIAKKLESLLKRQRRFTVHLTRTKDMFVSLDKRVSKARSVGADLLLSIHADSFSSPQVKGSSIFALSKAGASSSLANYLAAAHSPGCTETRPAEIFQQAHPDLAEMLLDLSLTGTLKESLHIGAVLLKELQKVNALHKKKVERADFKILSAPDVPSLLIETAFISNREEEKKLSSDRFQSQIAQALFLGIKQYFDMVEKG